MSPAVNYVNMFTYFARLSTQHHIAQFWHLYIAAKFVWQIGSRALPRPTVGSAPQTSWIWEGIGKRGGRVRKG